MATRKTAPDQIQCARDILSTWKRCKVRFVATERLGMDRPVSCMTSTRDIVEYLLDKASPEAIEQLIAAHNRQQDLVEVEAENKLLKNILYRAIEADAIRVLA